METPAHTPRRGGTIIKNIYLYLVSFVALMMLIFSAADIVNITLRTYVFTKADNFYYGPACVPPPAPTGTSTPSDIKASGCLSADEQKKQNDDQRNAQNQRDLVRDLSMIVVAIPVFMYHWKIVRNKEEGV